MTTRKRTPYIGVAGIMTVDELEHIARAHAAHVARTRVLCAGVLISSKSINGFRNKYPERYPSMERIVQLIDTSHTYGPMQHTRIVLHYASDDHATYAFQILGIKKYFDWQCAKLCMPYAPLAGFQLNAVWPDVRVFEDLHFSEHFGEYFRVILQLGPTALRLHEATPLTPQELVATLTPYIGRVSDILIDSSGGRGLPLPIQRVSEYLDAIHQANMPFGVGIAGGLDATTLDQVQSLFETYPDLSIDAEGLLRDPITDILDLEKVQKYIMRAHQVLTQKTI